MKKGEAMTPENFLYWLQGYLELANPKDLNEVQLQIIKDHIKLALTKVTPNKESFTTVTVPSLTGVPPGQVPHMRPEPTFPLGVTPITTGVEGVVTSTSTLVGPDNLGEIITSSSSSPFIC